MRTVPVVSQKDADKAREIEKRLLGLETVSGILFVGVSVVPGPPSLFKVWVGCDREREEGLISTIVHHVLREDLDKGLRIQVEAHRGIGRTSGTK